MSNSLFKVVFFIQDMLIIVHSPPTPPRSSPLPYPLKPTFEEFIHTVLLCTRQSGGTRASGRVMDTVYSLSFHEADILNAGTARKGVVDR